MYNNFYGFDKKPFTLNPDTDFLFLQEKHNDILSSLKKGLSNQFSLMVIAGDIGTGKSTLAQSLLHQIDEQYSTALLSTPKNETLEGMLKNFFIAFEIKNHTNHSTELANLLFENFLTTKFWDGKKVLLIIDDAHNLSADLLENIRLLSSFKINNKQLIQFILIGQKEFLDGLQTPKSKQILQSISLFEELAPLDLKETRQYIQHRLNVADTNEDNLFFTQQAFNSIYDFSGGIPSLINHICELSLISAFEKKIKPIDFELVEAIINEGEDKPSKQQKKPDLIQTEQTHNSLEQIRTPKKIAPSIDKHKPKKTKVRKTKKRNTVDKKATTSTTDKYTPSKEDVLFEEKIASRKTTIETHSIQETNSAFIEETQSTAQTNDKQNVLNPTNSKSQHKWLVITFAVSSLLYLYSKKPPEQDIQNIDDPLPVNKTVYPSQVRIIDLVEFNKVLIKVFGTINPSTTLIRQSIIQKNNFKDSQNTLPRDEYNLFDYYEKSSNLMLPHKNITQYPTQDNKQH